jgi:hypothetical protein
LRFWWFLKTGGLNFNGFLFKLGKVGGSGGLKGWFEQGLQIYPQANLAFISSIDKKNMARHNCNTALLDSNVLYLVAICDALIEVAATGV